MGAISSHRLQAYPRGLCRPRWASFCPSAALGLRTRGRLVRARTARRGALQHQAGHAGELGR
eukprot:14916146-Alexandrium_andersonii.AAC.1